MNPRPNSCCPYKPTIFEHYANVATHALAIVPSIFGAIYLINYAKTYAHYTAALIYGSSLIMLFSVSTLFHLFSMFKSLRLIYLEINFFIKEFIGILFQDYCLENFFHYCDRATIYIFIASSYTPWLHLRSTNSAFGQYMMSIVWIGAFLGIAYQIIFHEKYFL